MEKFLPVGVQNFEEMIKGNFVYVDKTRYIYEMVRIPQAFYFLSRPRRFGKSLLVSTLKALFEGKKELFKGLWIEKADWQWKKHPVVLIDFSGITSDTPTGLKKGILTTLNTIGKENGLQIDGELLPESFKELILALNEKYQEKVVVLVDEYDRPLISHLGMGEKKLKIAIENRTILKDFFGTLKHGDVSAALRFVFLTGISKFSKVSIFSDLNNLDDISMQEPFCSILGYTGNELYLYFDRYIEKLTNHLKIDKSEIKLRIQQWYNGYRFSDRDDKVYNPYSVLKLFKHKKFQSYWFETATPSFLVNLIKEKQYQIPEIETLELDAMSFSVYDIGDLELEPLLFQTGYLTIKAYQDELYRLSYPNQEVKTSFLSYIYDQIVDLPDSSQKVQYKRLQYYLREEAIDKFIETVNAILSSIPYPHIQKQDEHYYHTVFYLMLSASGVLVHTEVLSARGQVDIEVHFEDKVYIIELKCNQAAEKAIAQIRSKRYHEKHLQDNRQIILMGINFSTEERRITDWKLETVNEQ
ncbi:MAG: AAA family ATPase [Methanosarcinaceae archaeon]